MHEALLRPYRIIYGSLLVRLIFFFLSFAAVAAASAPLRQMDYAVTFRFARVVEYVYSVVCLTTGLTVFFALTELRGASAWFGKAATWFILEAAVNAVSDFSGVALDVTDAGMDGGSVLAAIYVFTTAAALLAPLFMNLFMFGHLLRGYREVCETCGKNGDRLLRLQRLVAAACGTLVTGTALLLLLYAVSQRNPGAQLLSGGPLLVSALALFFLGAVLQLIVQLRILRETRAMIALVKEISF